MITLNDGGSHAIAADSDAITVEASTTLTIDTGAAIHGEPWGATATATISGGAVTGADVVIPGHDYQGPPSISLTGGGGSGAAASDTITDGGVSAITISAPGTGYTSVPTIAIASPLIAARAYAALAPSGGTVAAITVTNGGAGYTAPPTVTISAPPSGTQATATAAVSAGEVTSVTITNGGTGYTPPNPAVTISPPVLSPFGIGLGTPGVTISGTGSTGTISGGTVTGGCTLPGVQIENRASLTCTGGTIGIDDAYQNLGIIGAYVTSVILSGTGSLAISGGTVSGVCGASLLADGNASINVTGGTVTGTYAPGVYAFSQSGVLTVAVSGGTVNGGIRIYAGGDCNLNATISGGTVNGGISVIFNGGAGSLTISGGALTGGLNSLGIWIGFVPGSGDSCTVVFTGSGLSFSPVDGGGTISGTLTDSTPISQLIVLDNAQYDAVHSSSSEIIFVAV